MNKKANFILDLDQTLVSAEPTEEFKPKSDRNFTKHNMGGYYFVFERPYLQDFLTFLFDNFNVSIWTAATKDYALYIIDNIILKKNSNRKIDYIFFAYHCNISEDHKNATKALSMFWDVYKMPGYDKCNTIILDDYDEVCETQPKNCIPIPQFDYNNDDSINDKFLQKLIPELKKLAEKHEKGGDIRENIKLINKKLIKG